MPFQFRPTAIPDVLQITSRIFGDPRGHFLETFKASEFVVQGADLNIVQANESVSAAGVLRGLHYQLDPHAMGKLARVLRGAVLDVAVDLRRGSPWFGQHVAMRLDADAGHLAWIPPGFAHGFCALEENTHFLYLQTGEYCPESEAGLDPFDPALGIQWPLDTADIVTSPRDRQWPSLADARYNFTYEPGLPGG